MGWVTNYSVRQYRSNYEKENRTTVNHTSTDAMLQGHGSTSDSQNGWVPPQLPILLQTFVFADLLKFTHVSYRNTYTRTHVSFPMVRLDASHFCLLLLAQCLQRRLCLFEIIFRSRSKLNASVEVMSFH